MHTKFFYFKKIITVTALFFFSLKCFSQNIGVFEATSDVGKILHAGSATYDRSSGDYLLAGSGTNIWLTHDDFRYVWKRIKGDFILQARGKLVGKGVEQHRKFGWMVRTSLDSTAAMVAATVHGDGLTSLQYRKKPHTDVEEIKFANSAPDLIQLERRGKQYIMSVAHFGEPYTVQQIGDVDLGSDVYVGLFICSHNKDVIEKVSFDNVRIIIPAKGDFIAYKNYIGSNIEKLDIFNGKREILYTSPESLQAPNWLPDGQNLIYNSNGLMYRFNILSKQPQLINTEPVKNNNNDHVISFNGKMLGLSGASVDGKYNSVVYTVPIKGGEPKQITPTGPSYLHGWSPDGKFLVFTGQRKNEFDIYKIPSRGGNEIRLTTSPGLDDGPEYTPNGKYIYFNSVRSGMMQIWRMNPDGTRQEQITNDEYNNWFPHISPDGKWIAFLSFMKDIKPDDHPFYKHVYLRIISASGGAPKVIAYLYGGQGSMNTPSWSPDSKKIAFISNSDLPK
ncbi:MAG: biopolymer transporter TolR [Bacteroidota bacterium]|nr:biopolymer transporter TolR [Bacteroidota bacterium]